MNRENLLIPSIVIAVTFIICVLILTSTWRSNYASNQTINVTGSAKKEIVSDLGVMRGSISVQSVTADGTYRELLRQKPVLVSLSLIKRFY